MMYFGNVVFAVSGDLNAPRHRMDILGCSLIGIGNDRAVGVH